MKPVYKCDYCKFMGTEEEVREHELNCMDNYDRRSCYTCKYRGMAHIVDKLVKYECNKRINVPAGSIIEFCKSYERKPKPDSPYSDLITSMFGK